MRKSKLHSELEKFLDSIGSSLFSCTPREICLFLAWSDQQGKTVIHLTSCDQMGKKKPMCQCPRRLAYGTVASKISQLKAIFESIGRLDSPISEEVFIYLNQIRVEQSIAHVMPLQAKPIFLKKLLLISMYLDRQLSKDLSFEKKFIYLRDQALFKLMFFSGDRGHDVGIMLAQEIKLLPDKSGFLIRHTYGKTHRVDNPNVFTIFKCPNETICPVKALELYVQESSKIGVDLHTGYLFRPLVNKIVSNVPLSYEAIYSRLKWYLNELDINEGETPHSFRGGCAITFGQEKSSSSLPDIMQHVGWNSETSANHYSRNTRLSQAANMSQAMSQWLGGVSYLEAGSADKGFIEESDLKTAF